VPEPEPGLALGWEPGPEMEPAQEQEQARVWGQAQALAMEQALGQASARGLARESGPAQVSDLAPALIQDWEPVQASEPHPLPEARVSILPNRHCRWHHPHRSRRVPAPQRRTRPHCGPKPIEIA
jgi:hypothetical protein